MRTDVDADLDAATARLERMAAGGYFRRPRSVSEVWCRLKDDGTPVDLVVLGHALSRMWRQGELLHTALCDGLLRYVDAAESAAWQSIDVPALGSVLKGGPAVPTAGC